MQYILSLTTTPTRIEKFLDHLELFEAGNKAELVIINVCSYYRRMNIEFKLENKHQYRLNDINKKLKRLKYVFNISSDYGAITKYIGGITYCKKNKIKNKYIIIVDDDTLYNHNLFNDLIACKDKKNITSGSGFNFDKTFSYHIVPSGPCQVLEGYCGVAFDLNQINNDLLKLVEYFKCVDFKYNDHLINDYLKACIMGDDFIISHRYKHKICIKNGRKMVQPLEYGFQDDALHKNNIFGSNMKSYKFLFDNLKVLYTFYRKIDLNRQIIKKINIIY